MYGEDLDVAVDVDSRQDLAGSELDRLLHRESQGRQCLMDSFCARGCVDDYRKPSFTAGLPERVPESRSHELRSVGQSL